MMITRFDHVVIAVRDLDVATQRYQQLGFDVRPGGRHTGLGTHNAIIRFGLDYIELLSIYDAAEAKASKLGGQALLDFLHEREGGLLGYALATTDIIVPVSYGGSRGQRESQQPLEPSDVGISNSTTPDMSSSHRAFQDGFALGEEPFVMQRLRPDGRLLTWRLLIPGGVGWRRPWPFLIQWDAPDEQRLLWEEPGIHPNGAIEWIAAKVAVHNLESVTDLYQHQLGLELQESGEVSHLAAKRTTFQLGPSRIDLLTPTAEGLVQQVLADLGEGLLEVSLAVKDLNQARSFLHQSGINFEPEVAGPGTLLISPYHALGARLILAEKG